MLNLLDLAGKNGIIVLVIIMTLNNWMSKLNGDTELFRLNLAGTHDCVTQYVQFSRISKCQNTNIYQQLLMGIRCLDIRVAQKGSRLGMVHGFAKAFSTPNHFSKQMDMAEVLKHCYRFLEENPTETVVFQFKNDDRRHQEKCFDNLYKSYILQNPNKWYLENRGPSLSEARGKIVLLRRCNKDNSAHYPLGSGIDFSRWVEQRPCVPEPLTLKTGGEHSMTFTVQDRFNYKPEPRWRQCILPFLKSMGEFKGNYVINYLSTAGGFKGPYENSKYINPRFEEFELNPRYYYGCIYMDFPTEKLVEKIVKTNFSEKREI